MKQRNGRITRFGNKTYKYDELGRLYSKTETKKAFRPVTTYYKWNSQSQLVELHSPFKGSWRYEYDSFGRRITKYQIQTDQPQPNQVINMPIRANQDYWHKINELWAKEKRSQTEKNSQKLTALSGYRYLYKQNQLVAEAPLQITCAEGNLALTQANWADAIYWLYQEDDFTPTARYEKGQLHYTVADQVGTITELLTEDGYIDYRQKLNLWGEAEIDGHRHYAANDSNPLKCNHRFVGQYYDDESELHYNRFRYYSPETGQYISHDPIGLLGGFNPYGYVFNPSGWIDPLGLQGCSPRDQPGVATGKGSSSNGKWLKGSHGNAGRIPSSVADKLRGREFKSFDEFRSAFWKAVSEDPKLTQNFSKSNISRMSEGHAPIAHQSQWNGGNRSYVLHHNTPIQRGGGVYDMNNITVMTPRFHLDVLDRGYHFGR